MADRPTRRHRRLLQAALIGLGVIAIVGAVLWLLLPAIAGRLVADRLAAMGVPEPGLTIVHVGLGRAVAVDLSAGTEDELTAQEIVVGYRYPDILDGTIESVSVRGATLDASIGPEGISLGSLDALLAPGGDGGAPALPPIEIEDARVDLATGFGAVTLTGGGRLTSADDGLTADLDLAATAPQGSARGTLEARIAGAGIDARLDLAESRIDLPGLLAATARGEMSARLADGEITALDGNLDIGELLFSEPRAAALGPLAGNVILARDAGAWRAEAALHDAADSLHLDLRLTTPALGLDETAVLALDLDATAPIWSLLGLPAPNGGQASIDAVAEAIPSALLAALGDGRLPVLTGSIAVDLEDVAFPGMVRSAAATGGFDVEMGGDTVRLTPAAPILADVRLDPTLLAETGLPPPAAALLAQPLAATIEFDGPLLLRRQGEGSTASGTAGLAIGLADGHQLLDAGTTGEIAWGPARTGLVLSALEARIEIPPDAGPAAGTLVVAGSGSMIGGETIAQLALSASAPRVEANGLAATDAKLDLPLALGYGEGRLTLRLAGKGSLSAARIAGTAPLSLDGPVQLAFIPGDVPLLAMDLADPQEPHGTVDLTAGPLRLAGTMEAEHGPMAGALSMPRLVLHAELDEAGWSAKITANDGKLDVSTYGIEATDLDLTAELPAGAAPRLALSAALAHRADPAVVVPLSASLTARQVKNGWAFTGHAADAFERLSIDVEGRHDLARNSGSATMRVAPIEFAPNVRQPGDLAPFLAGVAEEVSGTVALAGDLSWSAGGVASDLELLLRDVSATTDAAIIDRLNGVIAVDGLSPFSTPAGQRVAVAAIDSGLPLTDGLLTFRVAPGPKLEIAEGRLHLAGGTVNLEPLVFDPAGDSNEAVLAVSGVDLGELLALAGVDGLTGEGRLTGRIPVMVRDGDVIISNGELEAEAPGWLSYAPLTPPAALQGQGETVSLALSALTNFQYQALRLTVDRQAGGEMNVAMHVRGNNPDFYDGYPVEFNLNVSGALDKVLRQGLAGYRIPQAIEEQLKDFAQ